MTSSTTVFESLTDRVQRLIDDAIDDAARRIRKGIRKIAEERNDPALRQKREDAERRSFNESSRRALKAHLEQAREQGSELLDYDRVVGLLDGLVGQTVEVNFDPEQKGVLVRLPDIEGDARFEVTGAPLDLPSRWADSDGHVGRAFGYGEVLPRVIDGVATLAVCDHRDIRVYVRASADLFSGVASSEEVAAD